MLATNFNKLKNQEQKLNAQLLIEEKKKQELKQKITNAIRTEISIAENKRKKKAEKEEIELVFDETLWPDYRKEHFFEALDTYRKRARRFGSA